MHIGDRALADGSVYIIAELGVNHDGSPSRAMDLVEHAKAAGADAIKLQYFETDRLMSRSAKLAAYQKAAGETDPIAMLRRLELPIAEMGPLVDRAHTLGMHAIVTVFSTELVDPAGALPWDAYKTASPDLVHKPLLDRLTSTGLPLILSTGAATLEEVRSTCAWLREWGAADRAALLQCVSSYPTPPALAELGAIHALRAIAPGPVGYSDHTPDLQTGALAVERGALLLEKHLTYSRRAAGPDHAASLEPTQLAEYIRLARAAAASTPRRLDAAPKRVLPIEEDVRRVSRQSVVTRHALAAGHTLAAQDLTIKRPGTGIPARDLACTIGRRLARDVEADVVLMPEDLLP